jgi:hypothetical protein
MCLRPTSRVRRGGAADGQQPSGQLGCNYGTPPAGQPLTRGQCGHALPPSCHSLVEERSTASKVAASTSSRHLCSRSNQLAHSNLPTIQDKVNQPWANVTQGADLRASLDKNSRGRDARGYINQCHREREERELRRRLDYDCEYGPRAPSTTTWSMRSEIVTTLRTDDVPNTRRTTATLMVRFLTRIASPGRGSNAGRGRHLGRRQGRRHGHHYLPRVGAPSPISRLP